MGNEILLIPSARLIPPSLQIEFGQIPTALIPYAGKTMAEHILKSYNIPNLKCLLASNEGSFLFERILSNPKLTFKIINVGQTNSLGETILSALIEMDCEHQVLIINFADTLLLEEIVGDNSICYFRSNTDIYRWTTFELNDELIITDIVDKDYEKISKSNQNIFIGVFKVKNIPKFKNMLANAIQKKENDIDPFYTAIQKYFNDLNKSEKYFNNVTEWYDFGHLDTYSSSKRKLGMNVRAFNSLQVDERKGIIRKESENKDKLCKEIKWYLKIPKSLEFLTPRIFDYSLDFEKPYVELEYYGYPNLSDVYLYGNLNIGDWEKIFDSILFAIDQFKQHALNITSSQIRESLEDVYINKTISRLSEVIENKLFEIYLLRTNINSKECLSLTEICTFLPDVLTRLKIYDRESLNIIHGDFCLSNILYDARVSSIKLIDPRGSFGKYDIYGDLRYDFAKLFHSIFGDYDFLLNGLYDFDQNEGVISYKIHTTKNHDLIKKLFEKKIHLDSLEMIKIRLIESILFLSMVPLHYDKPKEQKAFLTKGIELFSDIYYKRIV